MAHLKLVRDASTEVGDSCEEQPKYPFGWTEYNQVMDHLFVDTGGGLNCLRSVAYHMAGRDLAGLEVLGEAMSEEMVRAADAVSYRFNQLLSMHRSNPCLGPARYVPLAIPRPQPIYTFPNNIRSKSGRKKLCADQLDAWAEYLDYLIVTVSTSVEAENVEGVAGWAEGEFLAADFDAAWILGLWRDVVSAPPVTERESVFWTAFTRRLGASPAAVPKRARARVARHREHVLRQADRGRL